MLQFFEKKVVVHHYETKTEEHLKIYNGNINLFVTEQRRHIENLKNFREHVSEIVPLK